MPEQIMLKVESLRRQTRMVVLSAAVSLLLLALVGFAVSTAPQAGTYLTSIKAEDIPANVPAEAKAIFVGEWTMTLAEDHSYRIAKDSKVLVEGHFVSSAEQIRFTDETGDLACTQSSEMKTGTYKWSYQGKKLTFTPVTDNCNGRRLVLRIHSWTQAPTDRETTIQEPPPTPNPTPAEDTARYVEWLKTRGASINNRPHEDVSLRIGDWGFFYHGDRPVGSWTPLLDRTALDRDGHAVTQTENSDWYALFRTRGLDAAGALRRVAWLLNADGVFPGSQPRGREKTTAPTITTKDDAITFDGWCEAHSDPPYQMRVTIVATANGTKLLVGR